MIKALDNQIAQYKSECLYDRFTIFRTNLQTIAIDSSLKNFIGSIECSFTLESEYKAMAIQKTKSICYNLEHCNISEKYTTAHEFAHFLYDYHLENDLYAMHETPVQGSHCLEFACIAYCIYCHLYPEKQSSPQFFRAYDIHEDIAYSALSINLAKFDSLINTIAQTSSSLDEILERCFALAARTRKELVV